MSRRPDRLGQVLHDLALGLMMFALTTGSVAQDTTHSLTQDFPKLSAKERARIAAREAEEAKQDEAYQGVMQAGEKAFQEGHYEDAMRLFEQARSMRPYNVYPKVKIEDLRALMARQGTAPNERPHTLGSVVAPDEEQPAGGPVAKGSSATIEQPGDPHPLDNGGPVQTTVVEQLASAPDASQNSALQPNAIKKADGLIERRYKDGRAYVIERIVRVEGRTVTYKRVYHPFGQVFFFEDGLSVDERVWKARFQGH